MPILPDAKVIKTGGQSLIDRGRAAIDPLHPIEHPLPLRRFRRRGLENVTIEGLLIAIEDGGLE